MILKYEWFSENKSFMKLDFIFIDFVTLFRTPLVILPKIRSLVTE